MISADIVIIDMAPSVGTMNSVAVMSSDYFIVPCMPDFYSFQAIKSISSKIKAWNNELSGYEVTIGLKTGELNNKPAFLGYVMQNYRPRNSRPAHSFQKWIDKIQKEIEESLVPVLKECDICVENIDGKLSLAEIADFNSLIAVSQELAKPVFELDEADLKRSTLLFGSAMQNSMRNVNAFRDVFDSFADKVLKALKMH